MEKERRSSSLSRQMSARHSSFNPDRKVLLLALAFGTVCPAEKRKGHVLD